MLVLLAAQTIVFPPDDPDRVVIDLTVLAPCVDEDDEGFDEEIGVCARKGDRNPHRFGATQGPAARSLSRAEVQRAPRPRAPTYKWPGRNG